MVVASTTYIGDLATCLFFYSNLLHNFISRVWNHLPSINLIQSLAKIKPIANIQPFMESFGTLWSNQQIPTHSIYVALVQTVITPATLVTLSLNKYSTKQPNPGTKMGLLHL